VNTPAEEVAAMVRECALDWVQLSGDEPSADIAQLAAAGISAVKTIRAGMDPTPFISAAPREPHLPALHLDASVPGEYGGTGRTADWTWAAGIAMRHPILLAGGLTSQNVAAAVRAVGPWGVDTASGVEIAPGRKDAGQIAAFTAAACGGDEIRAIRISPAQADDLPVILTLQKMAYQSEAELNGDYSIPPMTQSMAEIEDEFERTTFLRATANGRIIASVRAELRDGTLHIGRLIVHPEWQNRGIGSSLLRAVEERFSTANRYELFTSDRSERNLYLYRKKGYREIRRERISERVTLVYLEKANGG
jgi:phosphoribosylanthranilate isomerase/ribosomal protein S18 acetylase RimI-like enzyme